jgi:sulfate adenylyltransferase subunit 2
MTAPSTVDPRRLAARLTAAGGLIDEAVYILREVAGQFSRPVLLFSGGKDSVVLLEAARRAFWPAPVPFPVMHIDTGHNFPEVIAFRDAAVAHYGVELVVASVQESIDTGRVVERPGRSRNRLQSVTLLDAIAAHGFDAVLGGGRRDEEKARAKERVFSFRDEFGAWDPRAQRPELWDLYHGAHQPGEHVRVFPLSDWTELDIWTYLATNDVALPSLYFAHDRQVVERDGLLVAVTEHTPARPGEQVVTRTVRYRTVGDATCPAAVPSTAGTAAEIVVETATATVSERGATRVDDRFSDSAMEDRKREGYF